ncbi:MAG: ATP-binding protein, partial [Pseudomonadota bacterium]
LHTEGAYQGDIELAMAEAINNVVVHAFPERGQAKLHIRIDHHQVHCTIMDHGQAYTIPPAPTELARTGGFGWPLIRMLCNRVLLTREDSMNCLRMEFASQTA